MKTKDKNAVLELLASHPKAPKARYKVLVEKLKELDGATPSQKRFYNAAMYSPVNLEGLEYDLKKLCGITDREVKKLVSANKQEVKDLDVIVELPEALKDKLQDLDLESANYNTELKPIAKELSEALGVEPISQKKVDLIAFIKANFVKGPTAEELEALQVKIFGSAPEEVKQAVKLRDEFPFLNDADCPDEFKILVADKFTAYYNFVEGREELKALVALGASNDDLFEIASKTVKEFKLNLDIYDELNYYKEHKQILGKHPIFAEKMLEEAVNAMGTVELTKRQKNLRSYISRDQKTFDKMDDGEAKDQFGEKLQAWKDELDLVDARLEKIS